MNKSQKLSLVGIKHDLARLPRFKLGCFVCHSKKARGGMTFHHLYYLNGEKNYSDFKSTVDYYDYLAPLIRHQPERFLYVCNIHHQAITRLRRWRGANLNRMINAVKMTR